MKKLVIELGAHRLCSVTGDVLCSWRGKREALKGYSGNITLAYSIADDKTMCFHFGLR